MSEGRVQFRSTVVCFGSGLIVDVASTKRGAFLVLNQSGHTVTLAL